MIHDRAYPHDLPIAFWENNLEELDGEIARLATLCEVRILEPGVFQRVLDSDASVCGTENPIAFAKLRALLMMRLAIREKSVVAFGQAATAKARRLCHRSAKAALSDPQQRVATLRCRRAAAAAVDSAGPRPNLER